MTESHPYVIHVRRGEGRLNYRMTTWELIANRVSEMAWKSATDFIYLQHTRPDAAPLIDTRSIRPMMLKLPHRDFPLLGTLSLLRAFQEEWKEMDAVEIGGEGALSPDMSRARVVIVDLVDG